MRKKIIPYLEDLERRINPGDEQCLLDQWRNYIDGSSGAGIFSPKPRLPRPSNITWPDISVNDSLKDLDLMIIQQLKLCHNQLCQGGVNFMTIRPCYGVGTLPTILGCPVFIMPDEMDTLPNVYSLAGGISAIRCLAKGGPPGFDKGWGPAVMEVGEVFREIQEKYPIVSKYVHIDHPDTQGPLDICELLWGSDIFYALIEEPELVHGLLKTVTDFYIAFLDRWFALIPPVDGYHSFFGRLHKGVITIRNDSLMNLSAEMHKEFARPCDQRILNHYHGGMVHFCGRGDHFIEGLSAMEGLYAIDLSQPHLNDMETIARHTIDKGINLHTVSYSGAGQGKHHWERLSVE